MFPGPRRGPGRCLPGSGSHTGEAAARSAAVTRPSAVRSSFPRKLRRLAFASHEFNARADRKLGGNLRTRRRPCAVPQRCSVRCHQRSANPALMTAHATTLPTAQRLEKSHAGVQKKTPGTLTVFPAFKIIRRCLEREVDAGAGHSEVVIGARDDVPAEVIGPA